MTPERLHAFFADLAPRVEGELRTDPLTRALYATDASIYQAEPHGVLIARSEADLEAAVATAAAHGVPVLARGSGSSLAGQAVNEALVIDTSRWLDRVLDLDVGARRVRVEPGVVLDDLNRVLRPHGLQLGPDPASSDRATAGGMVSNDSTGSHSIRWGMTADHVIETGVVLADGTRARFGPCTPEEAARRGGLDGHGRPGLEGRIYRELTAILAEPAARAAIAAGTPRHWRRCGGYHLDRLLGDPAAAGVAFHPARASRGPESFNLAELVCGGEGGLAVIADVTLGLVPLPAATVLALATFPSLDAALEAVPAILETDPSAVELLDRMAIVLCRGVPAYARLLARFLDGDPDCVLITEYTGESAAAAAAGIERLRARRTAIGAESVVAVTEPKRQAEVWTVRKAGLGLLMSKKGDRKPIPFVEDAAVPVEHLAGYIAGIRAFCRDLGTEVACYGHASAGCVHLRPLIDAKVAAEVAMLPEILAFAVELLHGSGGSLSSEHGAGRARSWINERFFGPDLYALYRRVKGAFDPANLLNPGTVVEGPAMIEHLRSGPGYRSLPVVTELDFSHDLGFDRAVEMCNGAGVCRKRGGGTMCPSFMVTREEADSTRGRANALRAVLAGRLPPEELTGDAVAAAMDLCIQCKACKAECPSSVDMAKIKVEWLAQRHRRHGVPLRDRLIAGVARASRLASGPAAPLVDALAGSRPARWAMARWLGIDRRRSLPPIARRSFDRLFARLPQPGEAPRGRAVLFVDTFANYHHPEVAVAATELLAACGYRVVPSRHGCCGRPALSKGLVAEARRQARATVERLAPLAEEGLPIVGLEPSCLLTLRDEYRDLLPGDPRVERVAAAAELLEEHLARLAGSGEAGAAGERGESGLDLPFAGPPRRVLLHGHCHQKALAGTAASRRALSLPPGWEVEEVDSGCCGMAGSFGYETEHYEVSRAMAERRLLPAVRASSSDVLIVAAGTSCRQQILDLTGRRALHPAEALRGALGGAR